MPLWAADTVKVKLATLVPTGTTYHKSLQTLRDEWRKASGGTVDLIVYADGKLGSEADTVGLMGINSIQASLLSAVGLSAIEPAVDGLQSIPMGFNSLDEVDYVGDRLHPMLEERFLQKGFVVLFWIDAGWVRFFSKKPVSAPDDLKRLKLFCWAGLPDQVEIFKSAGFNAVPLETADIVPGLQTGLIEATPAPPAFALATQIDTRAPYMLELDWGPLVGACLIRKETWGRFPAPVRQQMLQIATRIGKEIKENGRKEGDEAVKRMIVRGLKVTPVTPQLQADWRKAAEATYPQVRGRIVPADIFDKTMGLIKEFRSKPAP